jgi:hypothetical protein
MGSYTVVITSAYLTTTSQPFSLIVTGGDLGFSSHDASAANTIDYNPNNCGTNERYVVLTATDHGGNGWGAGNSFEVRDTSDNSLVLSDTLTSNAGEQFRKTIPLCLPTGKTYSVALITNGANSTEMGLDVSPCNTYLSKYLTSSTFSISTDSSLYCGECGSEFKFKMILGGSFYGVPYGWIKESHYSLWNPTSGSRFAGTLVTGMYGVRYYCLPSGTWYLEYSDIPDNDDGFITDDFWAGRLGVEEYSITVSNGVTQKKIVSGQRATLSVSGTSASISKGNAAPTSSPTRSTSPTLTPTVTPTKGPTVQPTNNAPTSDPTVAPSSAPTTEPSVAPSRQPTPAPPTSDPTFAPSSAPSVDPTFAPSSDPTLLPTMSPSLEPTTPFPTVELTLPPTKQPKGKQPKPPKNPPNPPTARPSMEPLPTESPTVSPTTPTVSPTLAPTRPPTPVVTPSPTVFAEKTKKPKKPKNPKNPKSFFTHPVERL